MTEELLKQLEIITPEEKQIMEGQKKINPDLYMSSDTAVVDAKKLLEAGKLIQIRTHTRFVHFPKHAHNYIEVIYMCKGSTHHIINGNDVILKEGELLFLNQKAQQEIYPAGKDDIAVNFIILPEFFDYGLKMMETEKNMLRDFIVDCLKGKDQPSSYMHFRVAGVLPIQNLVENLIWTIISRQPNKRSINQITMGLLFLQLMNHMDYMELHSDNEEQKLLFSVLGYIEEHYLDGTLSQLAEQMHYDLYWLSKEIKKLTGRNYTELVQTRRLHQAAYLLIQTKMSVIDVGMAVGYDNISYFHKIFRLYYGMTPRKFRLDGNIDKAIEMD